MIRSSSKFVSTLFSFSNFEQFSVTKIIDLRKIVQKARRFHNAYFVVLCHWHSFKKFTTFIAFVSLTFVTSIISAKQNVHKHPFPNANNKNNTPLYYTEGKNAQWGLVISLKGKIQLQQNIIVTQICLGTKWKHKLTSPSFELH